MVDKKEDDESFYEGTNNSIDEAPNTVEVEYLDLTPKKNPSKSVEDSRTSADLESYSKPKKLADYQQKPVILEKEEIKREKKRFNEDPRVKENGVMLVNRATVYLGAVALIIFLGFLFISGIFVFQFSKLADKDTTFNSPVTNNNNYQMNYTIPVNVTNTDHNTFNIQINATVQIPNAKFYINESG